MGKVPDLVHVCAHLAPGCSGAPAVDGDLAVRGFVAAGSTDEAHPDTYLYLAGRWLAGVLTTPP
jgi:hypothetical protein